LPVYEYFCQVCAKKFSALIGMVAAPDDERCPACGSADVSRLVSKFTRGRTEDDRVDAIADQLEFMGDPDSPSAMRETLKDVGKALDEDVSDEMEELFEADMAGEPEDGQMDQISRSKTVPEMQPMNARWLANRLGQSTKPKSANSRSFA